LCIAVFPISPDIRTHFFFKNKTDCASMTEGPGATFDPQHLSPAPLEREVALIAAAARATAAATNCSCGSFDSGRSSGSGSGCPCGGSGGSPLLPSATPSAHGTVNPPRRLHIFERRWLNPAALLAEPIAVARAHADVVPERAGGNTWDAESVRRRGLAVDRALGVLGFSALLFFIFTILEGMLDPLAFSLL
jgi:hypothetical protein